MFFFFLLTRKLFFAYNQGGEDLFLKLGIAFLVGGNYQ